MKIKLMIIILVALFLVACEGDPEIKTATPLPLTLQEAGFSRYLDPELGVACYAKAVSGALVVFDCVSINK